MDARRSQLTLSRRWNAFGIHSWWLLCLSIELLGAVIDHYLSPTTIEFVVMVVQLQAMKVLIDSPAHSEGETMISTPDAEISATGTTAGRSSTLRPPSGKAASTLNQSHFQLFSDSFSITDTEPTAHTDDASIQSCETQIKSLFQKAYEYLSPGCTFRSTVYLYAERKLLVFFLIHFVCTMIIWSK